MTIDDDGGETYWPVHLMDQGWTVCGVDHQAAGISTTTDLALVTCRACRQGL